MRVCLSFEFKGGYEMGDYLTPNLYRSRALCGDEFCLKTADFIRHHPLMQKYRWSNFPDVNLEEND